MQPRLGREAPVPIKSTRPVWVVRPKLRCSAWEVVSPQGVTFDCVSMKVAMDLGIKLAMEERGSVSVYDAAGILKASQDFSF